jgi:hypothetical protein
MVRKRNATAVPDDGGYGDGTKDGRSTGAQSLML